MQNAFTERLASFIEEESLLVKSDHILVAVSGGRDSMCLLHALKQLEFTVSVAHMNYSLRGKESEEDLRFVRDYCIGREIPVYSTNVDCRAEAEESGLGIQATARKLRYDWFAYVSEEANAQFIATAHHLDDSIETQLINLIRGTGLTGLTGIPVKRDNIVRPLMCMSSDEIAEYIQEFAIPFREDSTNATDAYMRNRVRHHIIPEITRLEPGATDNMRNNLLKLGQHREAIREMESWFIQRFVRNDLHRGIIVDLERLRSMPSSAYLLSKFAGNFGFNEEMCNEILSTEKVGGRVLSQTHVMIRERDEIVLMNADDVTTTAELKSVSFGEKAKLDDGTFLASAADRPKELNQTHLVEYIDHSKVESGSLVIRNWRPGDRMRPLGMKGYQKISDLLTNAKVPHTERQKHKVVLDGEEIIWLIGVRIAEKYKITSDTDKCLKMAWEPG